MAFTPQRAKPCSASNRLAASRITPRVLAALRSRFAGAPSLTLSPSPWLAKG